METVAWKHEETRTSFKRYWCFAWLWLGGGAVGTVVSPWIGITADEAGAKWVGSVIAGLWVVSLSALLFGACWVFNAVRMRYSCAVGRGSRTRSPSWRQVWEAQWCSSDHLTPGWSSCSP